MRLLLDTHVALWATALRSRIPGSILDQIADPENDVFVSSIAIAEIAIKQRKRDHGPPYTAYEAITHFEEAGFAVLDVGAGHAAMTSNLPPIHSDPFDRIMIAQALVEGLSLVSYDKIVASYHPSILTSR